MWCMKTEVYSWRLSENLKSELKRQARARQVPISSILDMALRDWLKRNDPGTEDQETQRRLQALQRSVLAFSRAVVHCVPQPFAARFADASADGMVADALIDTGAILALLDRSVGQAIRGGSLRPVKFPV